ncbi:hypothetical protein ACQY0O_005427 [Thecaphora frezii]
MQFSRSLATLVTLSVLLAQQNTVALPISEPPTALPIGNDAQSPDSAPFRAAQAASTAAAPVNLRLQQKQQDNAKASPPLAMIISHGSGGPVQMKAEEPLQPPEPLSVKKGDKAKDEEAKGKDGKDKTKDGKTTDGKTKGRSKDGKGKTKDGKGKEGNSMATGESKDTGTGMSKGTGTGTGTTKGTAMSIDSGAGEGKDAKTTGATSVKQGGASTSDVKHGQGVGQDQGQGQDKGQGEVKSTAGSQGGKGGAGLAGVATVAGLEGAGETPPTSNHIDSKSPSHVVSTNFSEAQEVRNKTNGATGKPQTNTTDAALMSPHTNNATAAPSPLHASNVTVASTNATAGTSAPLHSNNSSSSTVAHSTNATHTIDASSSLHPADAGNLTASAHSTNATTIDTAPLHSTNTTGAAAPLHSAGNSTSAPLRPNNGTSNSTGLHSVNLSNVTEQRASNGTISAPKVPANSTISASPMVPSSNSTFSSSPKVPFSNSTLSSPKAPSSNSPTAGSWMPSSAYLASLQANLLPRTRFCAQPENHDRIIDAYTLALVKKEKARLAKARQLKGEKGHELTNAQILADTKKHVQIVWHVIHDGASGNLTEEQVTAQVDVLNQDYANYGFQFTLNATQYTNNAEWYRRSSPGSSVQDAMKNALHQGDAKVLNLYSVDFTDNLLGYSTFPWDVKTSPKDDGVVFQYSTVPGGSETGYNKGKTATHEIGHWLGLYHVFQGGCTGQGDLVDDTPPQSMATNGCPIRQDSCAGGGADSIHK